MSVKASVRKAEKREDPRVKRTRGLIFRAFWELMAEKGHAGITVQEIAGRATINRATFYAHFADQYELFDRAISEDFREELRSRLPPSPGPSEKNLRALVLVACDYLAWLNTGCPRTDRQFRPIIEDRVQRELYELLLGWMKGSENEDGHTADPEAAASAASWAIFGTALDWSRSPTNKTSAQQVANRVLPVIVEGLRF